LNRDRVVLAYSGGLDTTVAVRWLDDKHDLDVVAVLVDVGQGADLEPLRLRALEAGATEAIVVDARAEFAEDFCGPALIANALYQRKYPLVSALSRPLICRHLADAAFSRSAHFLAHGCTGKGNDQVRFEVSLGALAPELEVLAPARDWGMNREETVEYGLEHGLPIDPGPKNPYSIDENLWGRAIECGALEDPWHDAPADIWDRTVSPADAPREPRFVEIDFIAGLPIALDGEKMDLGRIVQKLDELAGGYGFGRIDMVEDRVVGIKSREVYEVPGALALITAHTDLEELTLDREVLRTKRGLEDRYAQLVYEGLWFSPLRQALEAFNQATSQYVNGRVRLQLEPGSARVTGRSSDRSLYQSALATYEHGDQFDHASAQGFVRLWGLPVKTWARTHQPPGSGDRDES
jgi:argininosuccinate synthase